MYPHITFLSTIGACRQNRGHLPYALFTTHEAISAQLRHPLSPDPCSSPGTLSLHLGQAGEWAICNQVSNQAMLPPGSLPQCPQLYQG